MPIFLMRERNPFSREDPIVYLLSQGMESGSDSKGERTNRARCGRQYRLVLVGFLWFLSGIASGSDAVCEGYAAVGMLLCDLDSEDADDGRLDRRGRWNKEKCDDGDGHSGDSWHKKSRVQGQR